MNWSMIITAMAITAILSLLGCIIRKEKISDTIVFVLASTLLTGCLFVLLDRLLVLKLISAG